MRTVWIGYDARESEAFAVCRYSLRRRSGSIPIQALCLDDLRDAGIYRRPTSRRDGKLWDDISDAPMSTEFAISRFLTPHLAGSGWAMFLDCDMLFMADVHHMFASLDKSKAVYCVQHPNYTPPDQVKMDGQMQTLYARKNWSSVMVFNCDHPANKEGLTVDLVNTVPGRDLHRFCWLSDDLIGKLGPEWNHLVGVTNSNAAPKLIHYTSGGPWFEGYKDCDFAAEWLAERNAWLQDDTGAHPRAVEAISKQRAALSNGVGHASA